MNVNGITKLARVMQEQAKKVVSTGLCVGQVKDSSGTISVNGNDIEPEDYKVLTQEVVISACEGDTAEKTTKTYYTNAIEKQEFAINYTYKGADRSAHVDLDTLSAGDDVLLLYLDSGADDNELWILLGRLEDPDDMV